MNALEAMPRPLMAGEFRPNQDGSRSTEILITVTHPSINRGRPTNIPSMWMVGGKPVEVPEELAIELASKSRLRFPSFDSIETAVATAKQRSAQGGVSSGPLGAPNPLRDYAAPNAGGAFPMSSGRGVR